MEVKKKAKDAMLAAIEKERDGDQIDRSLLKNVLGIFIEVGMGGMECYNEDFEQHLLSETASYYRKKATVWIAVRTPPSRRACLEPLSATAACCHMSRHGHT